MRRLWMGLSALALAATAGPAAAAQYMFSYGFGGTTYASGIITTDTDPLNSCGPGCFVPVGVSGTNRGATISGYDPGSIESSQYFYPTRAGAYVDGSGLTYMVGSTSYTIYSVGSGNYNEYHFDTATGTQIGSSQFITSFTVMPAVAAVPEPATWAMLVAGIGAVGGTLRRRRRWRETARAA